MRKNTKAGIDECKFIWTGVDKSKYLELQDLINEYGMRYGKLECRNGKAYVYANLPSFIRSDNIHPFSITDMIKLEIMESDLEKQLKWYLGDDIDISKFRLVSIECNITQKVSGESTCSQVLNLINRSCYNSTNIVYQRASTQCRYIKDDETVIIRSSRKNYYILKCYDKSLQQRKNGNKTVEKGLLRIEIIMQDRIIKKLFGDKLSMCHILKKQSLLKVMDEYKKIFVDEIIEQYIRPCLTDMKNILFNSLLQTESPTKTIALHKELIVDEEVLRQALKKWYASRKMPDNSKQEMYHLKQHCFPKDVIKTISDFKYSCG